MKNNSVQNDKELRAMMQKGLLDIPDPEFETKIMQRVMLASQRNTIVRKNLRASWFFLAISIVLFPAGFMAVYRQLDFSFLPAIGESMNNLVSVFLPAGVLLFSVVVLLQIDNLLRLSIKPK
ncbi:MAG TPA: hypothetical protein DDX98_04510 [Bacteroidales bacterium]|jgi:hypothetical protein|nr:hypothetical protein [Bacteroidales bacterium]